MTSSIADYVVSLGLDGRVVSCGSVSDAVAKDKTLAAELVEGVRAIKDEEKRIDQEESDATAKQADGKLIVAEEIAEGHVSWDACKLPFTSSAVPLIDPLLNSQAILQRFGGTSLFPFLDIVCWRPVTLRCLVNGANVVHGILGRTI